MGKKLDITLLAASVCGFFAMSVSFLLMPLETLGALPGMLFWIGLLLGVGTQVILEIRRRVMFSRFQVSRKKMQKARNGLLSFFSNPAAKAVDIGLAVSLLVCLIVFSTTRGLGYICFVCIFATVFLFCMHCVLNGRIFIYVRNHDKIQNKLEQTHVSKKKKERKV